METYIKINKLNESEKGDFRIDLDRDSYLTLYQTCKSLYNRLTKDIITYKTELEGLEGAEENRGRIQFLVINIAGSEEEQAAIDVVYTALSDAIS